MRKLGLCLLLAIGGVDPAAAQHPRIDEPAPRPLHVRLALADAVAIARVEEVGVGRIRLLRLRPVVGEVEASFELKRSPSAPAPIHTGDRLTLLLRGARSPYLGVDRAGEIPRPGPDEAAETEWVAALRALHRALATGAPPAPVFAGWVDHADPGLAREAAIGLADADLDVAALPSETFERLADLATGAADAALRQAAARAAVRSPQGLERLMTGLPGDDPRVLTSGLRAALAVDLRSARAALIRGLRHEVAEMRATALRVAGRLARERPVRAEIVRIAGEDPEAALRELARRVMHATAAPARPAPTGSALGSERGSSEG